jgi:hypothetical protein
MPVPSQGHCGFPSFPVVDWFCLFVDLWVLPFPLEDCSVFGNFVFTLIDVKGGCSFSWYWWNCRSSLIIPSFHNDQEKTNKKRQTIVDKVTLAINGIFCSRPLVFLLFIWPVKLFDIERIYWWLFQRNVSWVLSKISIFVGPK